MSIIAIVASLKSIIYHCDSTPDLKRALQARITTFESKMNELYSKFEKSQTNKCRTVDFCDLNGNINAELKREMLQLKKKFICQL